MNTVDPNIRNVKIITLSNIKCSLSFEPTIYYVKALNERPKLVHLKNLQDADVV